MLSLSRMKEARIYNGENTVFSISDSGTAKYEKKRKIEHSLMLYTKINTKWIKVLKVKSHTIKLLDVP